MNVSTGGVASTGATESESRVGWLSLGSVIGSISALFSTFSTSVGMRDPNLEASAPAAHGTQSLRLFGIRVPSPLTDARLVINQFNESFQRSPFMMAFFAAALVSVLNRQEQGQQQGQPVLAVPAPRLTISVGEGDEPTGFVPSEPAEDRAAEAPAQGRWAACFEKPIADLRSRIDAYIEKTRTDRVASVATRAKQAKIQERERAKRDERNRIERELVREARLGDMRLCREAEPKARAREPIRVIVEPSEGSVGSEEPQPTPSSLPSNDSLPLGASASNHGGRASKTPSEIGSTGSSGSRRVGSHVTQAKLEALKEEVARLKEQRRRSGKAPVKANGPSAPAATTVPSSNPQGSTSSAGSGSGRTKPSSVRSRPVAEWRLKPN